MKTIQQPIKSSFGEQSTPAQVLAGIDLRGKATLVTGGHSGIGYETTRALTKAGASLVVGARNAEKARKALTELRNVEVLELDLSEPVSIDRFADQYRKLHRTCDILINNAGIMATPLQRNSQGYEMQFATNHLGHFRLASRLWDTLCDSKARVVSLSSLGHRFGGVNFEDPNFMNHPYEKWAAYGQAKTANSLFAVHLDKVGKEFGVRAFAVHPGRITTTNLSRFMSEEEKTATANAKPTNERFVPSFVKTVEQGAATTLWAATSPRLNGMGGVYCANCDISPLVDDDSPQTDGVRKWAVDPVFALKLWEMSGQLSGF